MLPEESQDELLLTAMDEGVTAATPEPTEPETDEAKPEGEAAPEGETPPVPPEAEKLEGEQEPEKAEAKPEEEKPADQEAEAEISKLGLKEQSAARFRELSSTVKELAPIREQLESAGFTTEDLPRVIQRAKDADELIGQVMETGATPEQYSMALSYLAMVNAASKGDRASAEKAYDMMAGELAELAKALGKEVPGIHDPLSAHADLMKRVEDGDLSRADALEMVRLRNHENLSKVSQEQTAKQREHEAAAATATDQIAKLDAHYFANDPNYAIKRDALSEMVADIKQRFPPSQWAAATQRAYVQLSKIPVAVPPPPKPASPSVGPVRPGPRMPASAAPEFKDPMEAMDFGIKQAGA